MAKAAAKPKKEVSMEEALWKSADKLRGSVEPAEYKHVVLSLFFLGLAVFFSIYCVEFFTEIDYNIFMLILGTR